MPTYLVTGATGRQGGAVVDHLLAAGHKVRALVRDKSSSKAISLSDRGVTLFEGTHEQPSIFTEASANCQGFFLNISVFEPGLARAQAQGIIDACKSTSLHIVLSSSMRTAEMA